VLYHGPVRVPGDARPGKTVVRFELPKDAGFVWVPTDIAVELVKAAKPQDSR
jgi:hypothetical protein